MPVLKSRRKNTGRVTIFSLDARDLLATCVSHLRNRSSSSSSVKWWGTYWYLFLSFGSSGGLSMHSLRLFRYLTQLTMTCMRVRQE